MASARDALPRGPHGLSREEVADSQRERLLAATTTLLAEKGYADMTIGDLVQRARVSRGAFYAHFADKEACLLASYDRWAVAVLGSMTLDLPPGEPWPAFVERSLRSYLQALQDDRPAALAYLVRMDEAGPAARRRRREGAHGFAALLIERHRAVRALDPALGPLPDRAFLGFTLGVRELIREQLEERPDGDLLALLPDLLVSLTALVRGAEEENRRTPI